MSADPVHAVKAALFARLAGDTLLQAELGTRSPVDHPARSAALPLIRFGPATANDWSTGDSNGWQVEIALDLFARLENESALATARERVRALLADDLEPEGLRVVLQTLANENRLDTAEDDERAARFVARFLIEQTQP